MALPAKIKRGIIMAKYEKSANGVQNDKEFAIDLGTAYTIIYQRDKGIVLREPSVIAVDVRTDEVLAAGLEAKEMIGKTPEQIIAINPMARGAVADLPACTAMLKYFMHKVNKGLNLKKPKAMISVPASLTDVERRAVEEVARGAGISSVSLFEAPMAAALGAELPIGAARGSLVLNFGAGVSEAAVISLGDIVSSVGERIGSFDIDEAIMRFTRRQYGLLIGANAAEEVKIKIGSAFPVGDNSFTEVRGRSISDGLPRSCTIQADELREVIQPIIIRIAELVARCLESAPAELSADVFDSGIVITGMAGELEGLGEFITEYTGVKAVIPERSRDCVAEGTGKSLDLVISDRGVRRFRRKSV